MHKKRDKDGKVSWLQNACRGLSEMRKKLSGPRGPEACCDASDNDKKKTTTKSVTIATGRPGSRGPGNRTVVPTGSAAGPGPAGPESSRRTPRGLRGCRENVRPEKCECDYRHATAHPAFLCPVLRCIRFWCPCLCRCAARRKNRRRDRHGRCRERGGRPRTRCCRRSADGTEERTADVEAPSSKRQKDEPSGKSLARCPRELDITKKKRQCQCKRPSSCVKFVKASKRKESSPARTCSKCVP